MNRESYQFVICMFLFCMAIFVGIPFIEKKIEANELNFEDVWKNETIDLVSLERGSETSGSFVLGFGSVNQKIVYYAYKEFGDRAYMLKSFEHTDYRPVIILERNVTKGKYIKSSKYRCRIGDASDCTYDWNYNQFLVVPIGTIHKKYEG